MTDIAEFYRIPAREAAQASAQAQIDVFRDLERIRATTPSDARIMWYGPSYVALIAGRRGLPMDFPENAAALTDQVRRLRPDFIYFATAHPRDSGARHGSPLAPWVYAMPYSQIAWRRIAPASGELKSVLLQVDPAKLAPP